LLSRKFLAEFRGATEGTWGQRSINPTISGFQFQPGTRWNPGLSDEEVAQYETVLGVRLPHDFRAFLGAMNGTDLPTVNVYASTGEPRRKSVGVYSYPRDLEIVKLRIEDVRESRDEIAADLREQGYDLRPEAALVPIYLHRYVVCTSDLDRSVVLSIVVQATDAIVYGNSLREYLEREFLGES
jgi:hypothetical protein